MIAYKTSKDYKHLIELLDKGIEVVCFVTYDFNQHHKEYPNYKPLMTTDVCIARLLYKGGEYEHYTLSCRGTGFIDYWTHGIDYNYTFEEMLESENVEYIEPNIP